MKRLLLVLLVLVMILTNVFTFVSCDTHDHDHETESSTTVNKPTSPTEKHPEAEASGCFFYPKGYWSGIRM